MDDWTHVWPIRGGGSGGEASGDGRRRGSGSTVARGSGCGEMPVMLGQQVWLEAHVWAMEELSVMGWSRAQARVRAHRRR
jgi:hypothetical protein